MRAFRSLLRPLRRCAIRIRATRVLGLPPIARDAVPADAPGELHEWYNAGRKAFAIALYLYATGHGRSVSDREVMETARALGWPQSTPRTLVLVGAALADLHAAPGVTRQRPTSGHEHAACPAEYGGPGYTRCELPGGHAGAHESALGSLNRAKWGAERPSSDAPGRAS